MDRLVPLLPTLDDETLCRLRQRIRPVARLAGASKQSVISPRGILYYVDEGEPKNTSLLAHVSPVKPAHGLRELGAVLTYFPLLSDGGCGPTAEMILAQLPRWLLNQIRAYEVRFDYGEGRIIRDCWEVRTVLYGEV